MVAAKVMRTTLKPRKNVWLNVAKRERLEQGRRIRLIIVAEINLHI
jgi:hypothetical protein